MKILVALLLLGLSQILTAKMRFDDYRVYRLTPRTDEAVSVLRKMESKASEINFWTGVGGKNVPVDVMIPPYHTVDIENLIKGYKIDSKLINSNIQNLIDNESKFSLRSKGFDWNSYHDLEEIYNWLYSLEKLYPDVVTVVKGGETYEKRDILGVHLTFNKNNTNNAIFLESNIHAREWISSATTTWILNEFLTSKDADIRALAQSHDWYIFPVFNPDGFVFTHTNNRLWRKTRVPYSLFCYGADPNRNWGYHWNEGGSSNNPCSDTYNGPHAFSEPSTKSLSEYITTISDKLIAYIGFHSYSQLLLIPYGYTSTHLDNYDQLLNIGTKAAASLKKRYGTDYTVGGVVETIYPASGGSFDWVKGTFKTPVTYTYELRDKGKYGFLLPPEQIIPTARETMDSLITMFKEYDEQTKHNYNLV